jgi:hypothetical protein
MSHEGGVMIKKILVPIGGSETAQKLIKSGPPVEEIIKAAESSKAALVASALTDEAH